MLGSTNQDQTHPLSKMGGSGTGKPGAAKAALQTIVDYVMRQVDDYLGLALGYLEADAQGTGCTAGG